jgi:hypothetical protein
MALETFVEDGAGISEAAVAGERKRVNDGRNRPRGVGLIIHRRASLRPSAKPRPMCHHRMGRLSSAVQAYHFRGCLVLNEVRPTLHEPRPLRVKIASPVSLLERAVDCV